MELPELTPEQADFLWNFLEDLASDLWDAYENDIDQLEYAFSREAHGDQGDGEYEAHLKNISPPPDQVDDPDPDF
jgi:hypothetical protein